MHSKHEEKSSWCDCSGIVDVFICDLFSSCLWLACSHLPLLWWPMFHKELSHLHQENITCNWSCAALFFYHGTAQQTACCNFHMQRLFPLFTDELLMVMEQNNFFFYVCHLISTFQWLLHEKKRKQLNDLLPMKRMCQLYCLAIHTPSVIWIIAN